MKPSQNTPLFVVGESRSGTTLVYFCLLASDEFPVYRAETNLLVCRAHYGRLGPAANTRRFLEEFTRSRQFRRSGLAPAPFSEAVRASCTDYVDVLRELMDRIAMQQGKTRWVEKTPLHAWHLPRLGEGFPKARFIHVVRDARDVALSKQNLGWTPRFRGLRGLQLLWAVQRWNATIRLVERYRSRHPDRVMTLRYEDLVMDTEASLARLSRFAGTSVDLERIRASDLAVLGESNTAYGDGEPGFSTRPVFRWKEELSADEARILTWAAEDTLERYSYELPALESPVPDFRMKVAAVLLGGMVSMQVLGGRSTVLGRLAHNPLEFPGDE